MPLFKHRLVRGVPSSRTQQMMVEQRAKELEDFRRMLRPEAEQAFGEVLGMGANADVADYLEPASPRRGWTSRSTLRPNWNGSSYNRK